FFFFFFFCCFFFFFFFFFNELDFFDQELLMMNRCRNSIDKIGRNFHYIIVNDQTRVLDKDGFYQDAERLTTEIFNLKNQFENY
ncbi:hypothetical protein K797_23177, partial [Salmonella enterica subsp. enterica serovar Newport str. SHSN008]